jgi:hypothetical protein
MFLFDEDEEQDDLEGGGSTKGRKKKAQQVCRSACRALLIGPADDVMAETDRLSVLC